MAKSQESTGKKGDPDFDQERLRRRKQLDALYAEWREDYAARARESAGQDTWQVWHAAGYPESRIAELMGGPAPVFPRDYIHVADVPAACPDEAVRQTTHGGNFLEGTGQSWEHNPGVFARVFAPRDTDAGDVIVDPSRRAYRVESNAFRRIGEATQSLPSPSEIVERSKQKPAEPEQDRHHEKDRGRE